MRCVAEAVLRDDGVGIEDEDGLAMCSDLPFAHQSMEWSPVGVNLGLGGLHGVVTRALIGKVDLASGFELGGVAFQRERRRDTGDPCAVRS